MVDQTRDTYDTFLRSALTLSNGDLNKELEVSKIWRNTCIDGMSMPKTFLHRLIQTKMITRIVNDKTKVTISAFDFLRKVDASAAANLGIISTRDQSECDAIYESKIASTRNSSATMDRKVSLWIGRSGNAYGGTDPEIVRKIILQVEARQQMR